MTINQSLTYPNWLNNVLNVQKFPISKLTPLMMKQQKTALNMAKFIQNQSLLLLEKLNELDLDAEADLCEKLHDDAEHLFRTLSSRLDALQDGN